MRKIILRSLLILLSVIMICVILLLSPAGLKLGVWLGQKFIPEKISYQTISGSLIGPIHITGFRYHDNGQEITIKSLSFNWQLSALLKRRLVIDELKAEHVIIRLPDSPITPKTLLEKIQFVKAHINNLKMLMKIRIHKIDLTDVQIYKPQQHLILRVNKLKLAKNNIVGDAQTGDVKLQFVGKVAHKQFLLQINHDRLQGGSLNADLKISWLAEPTWQINLQAAHINLTKISENLPKDFNATIQSQGSLLPKNWQFKAQANIQTDQTTFKIAVSHEQQWDTGAISAKLSLLKSDYSFIHSLTASLTGSLAKHNLQIQSDINNAKFSLNLTGQYVNNAWQGSINSLELPTKHYQNWQLAQKSVIKIQGGNWQIQPICMNSSSRQQICLTATAKNYQWNSQITASKIDAKLLSERFFPEATLNSEVNAKINLAGNGLQLQQGKATINLSAGNVRYLIGNNTYDNSFLNSEFALQYQEKAGLKSQFRLNLTNQDYSDIHINFEKSNKISGTVRTHLNDIKLLTAFIPNVAVMQGKINSDMTLGGTLKNPILKGKINLLGGEARIPILNLILTNINFDVAAEDSKINYTAHATSGGAPITISGQTDLRRNYFSALKVTGNSVLISDTPEYKIYASPNVTIDLNGKNISLIGDVTIPKATITLHDFRNVVTLPTDEMTFIGKQRIVEKSPWNVTINLNTIVGDDVTLDTMGIKGKLTGRGQLTQQPKQTLLATGRVTFSEGVYNAFGQTLKISKKSYMQYNHNQLVNPTFSLRASKKVSIASGSKFQSFSNNMIKVGVLVRGTFLKPTVSLFSSQGDLTQSEILSVLLTGTLPSPNAKGDFSLTSGLLRAIQFGTDGLGGTSDLINDLRSNLGFNELGLESETSLDAIGNPLGNQTNFVVGRHLTKNLYIRYSRGIYGPGLSLENKIQLRYLLNKNWALQLDTNQLGNGTGTGGDILYTIEKK